MHIVFINYSRFVDSGGIHIHFLANEFEKMGIRCTVLIPEPQTDPNVFGIPLYRIIDFETAGSLAFLKQAGTGTDKLIIHAWTPRENVRRFTLDLAGRLGVPWFVHMEDNEELILSAELGIPYSEITRLPPDELDERLPSAMIRPGLYEKFLSASAGVSCIFESLEKFVPAGVPVQTFWPACEPEFFEMPFTPDQAVRATLGIGENDIAISYTGNMHPNNAGEVTSLYHAVSRLNDDGTPVKLIRTGSNTCPFTDDVKDIQARHVIELGSRTAAELRKFIAAADILVQPGSANDFNNYRFPSKLPMFLASCRPVILPPANIGRHLSDGKNCLILQNDSVEEMVAKISLLAANPELRHRLGSTGRAYASKHFNWKRSAKKLLRFYRHALMKKQFRNLMKKLGL